MAAISAVVGLGAAGTTSLAQPATAQPVQSATPGEIPSSSPSPEPTPTPLATPTILMLPPDAAPQILWVQVSSNTPRAGDVLTGTVLTSSKVASVEIRVGGFSVNMNKTDIGRFEASYRVPSIPFFMSHDLVMEIIARNTGGVATTTSLPLQVR